MFSSRLEIYLFTRVALARAMTRDIGILVIGTPDQVGDISLQSIIRAHPNSKIHAMVDSDGFHWLNVRSGFSDTLCFHYVENSDVTRWKGNFESFGSIAFNELTRYKWILILETFEKHLDQSEFLFTDLDIFWRSKLKARGDSEDDSSLIFQMDCDSIGRRRFCTGVVFIKRSGIHLIQKILNFQSQSIARNEALNDEKACNRFIFGNELEESVANIPREEAIIGRDFLRTLTWWRNMSCFHANYMNVKQKRIALECMKLRNHGNPKWIFLFFVLATELLSSKLKARFNWFF